MQRYGMEIEVKLGFGSFRSGARDQVILNRGIDGFAEAETRWNLVVS